MNPDAILKLSGTLRVYHGDIFAGGVRVLCRSCRRGEFGGHHT